MAVWFLALAMLSIVVAINIPHWSCITKSSTPDPECHRSSWEYHRPDFSSPVNLGQDNATSGGLGPSCPASCRCAAGAAYNGGLPLSTYSGMCNNVCSIPYGGVRYCGGNEYATGDYINCTSCQGWPMDPAWPNSTDKGQKARCKSSVGVWAGGPHWCELHSHWCGTTGTSCPDGTIRSTGVYSPWGTSWSTGNNFGGCCKTWRHAALQGVAFACMDISSTKKLCTKQFTMHVHLTARSVGVLLYKRVYCDGGSCDSFKVGKCIKLDHDHYPSVYNNAPEMMNLKVLNIEFATSASAVLADNNEVLPSANECSGADLELSNAFMMSA